MRPWPYQRLLTGGKPVSREGIPSLSRHWPSMSLLARSNLTAVSRRICRTSTNVSAGFAESMSAATPKERAAADEVWPKLLRWSAGPEVTTVPSG